jgi:hypothetical protein
MQLAARDRRAACLRNCLIVGDWSIRSKTAATGISPFTTAICTDLLAFFCQLTNGERTPSPVVLPLEVAMPCLGRGLGLGRRSWSDERADPPGESVGLFGHWRIRFALALYLRLAGTPLLFGNGVHDHGNVIAAAPPGGFACESKLVHVGRGVGESSCGRAEQNMSPGLPREKTKGR